MCSCVRSALNCKKDTSSQYASSVCGKWQTLQVKLRKENKKTWICAKMLCLPPQLAQASFHDDPFSWFSFTCRQAKKEINGALISAHICQVPNLSWNATAHSGDEAGEGGGWGTCTRLKVERQRDKTEKTQGSGLGSRNNKEQNKIQARRHTGTREG